MSSCSREKIALVVFGALIVLSLFGLGCYVLAGHSWNVAASNIDDTFGSMEGYTAIVYPGTKKPEIVEKSDDDGALPEAPAGIDEAGIKAGTLAKKPLLSVGEAKENYEAKKAVVFELDTLNLAQYGEGIILKKGNHRFGVFSMVGPLSRIMLEKQLAYFQRHEVDFIVAITPDKSYVDAIGGIDIVICTKDEGLFVMGETIDGTFYVDTPEEGRIGTILISPSNVVSAKVIESR